MAKIEPIKVQEIFYFENTAKDLRIELEINYGTRCYTLFSKQGSPTLESFDIESEFISSDNLDFDVAVAELVLEAVLFAQSQLKGEN